METQEIEKVIKDLQVEIQNNWKDEEKEEALLRLQETAKNYAGADKVVSSLELYEEIKKRPPQRKIMTGLKELDDILDGFREKQLIVLSGITKHGKTSLAMDFTVRLKEENPLWFPFEQPAEELIQMFHERNLPIPFFYTPQNITGDTINWIEKKIIEGKAKFNCKIIFIDHLHFIINKDRSRSSDTTAQEIGHTMRSLKKMAIRWNIIIVIMAHLKKIPIDSNPNLEDLKDSSSIPQEADTVILLWRKTTKEKGKVVITDEVNLSVQANRRTGKTGNIELLYKKGQYFPIDKDHTETIEAKDIDSKW